MKKAKDNRSYPWITPLLGLPAALVLAFLMVLIASWRVRVNAQDCFRTVSAYQLGKSGFEDVQRLRNRFGGTDITPGGHTCSSESCQLVFAFDNRWLSQFGLAPITAFGCSVVVEHGHVSGRGITYISSAQNARGSYFVTEFLDLPGSQGFAVFSRRDPEGKPIETHVRLTSAASQDVRLRTYSVDLSCLSKLGGCSDRSRIFPELQDTADAK